MPDYRPPPPGAARRQPPPPPGTDNRRRFPRYELLAQVEIDRDGGEVILLDVGNVSAGGLFVLADDEQTLVDSDVVDVFIDIDGEIELRAKAEVVRITEAGIAMRWRSDEPQIAADVTRLLEHIRGMADED